MMTAVLRVFETGSTNAHWCNKQVTMSAYRVTSPKKNLLPLIKDLNEEMTICQTADKLEELVNKLLEDNDGSTRVDAYDFGSPFHYGFELMTVYGW